MARKRDPARDKAKLIWLESGKSKPLKEIASELGKKPAQIRKWKLQDHWDSCDNSKRNGKRNVTNAQKERYHSKGTSNGNDDHALSSQQELFAQLVGGKRIPLYRAYQAAYSATKPSLATAMANSSALAKDEKIRLRITKISQETARKHDWSLDRVVDSYTFIHDESKADIVTHGVRKATADAMIQSLEDITDVLSLKPEDQAKARKSLIEAQLRELEYQQVSGEDEPDDQRDSLIEALQASLNQTADDQPDKEQSS